LSITGNIFERSVRKRYYFLDAVEGKAVGEAIGSPVGNAEG
jgi:hypothetical protein